MNLHRPLSRIAIVDDDDSVRRALGRLVRGAGYAVDAHASGKSLLDGVEQSPPDCIILDVNMPGMDGFAVHLELARRGLSIPVIFITANQDLTTQQRAGAAGAAAFMSKPVESTELLDAIAAALAG